MIRGTSAGKRGKRVRLLGAMHIIGLKSTSEPPPNLYTVLISRNSPCQYVCHSFAIKSIRTCVEWICDILFWLSRWALRNAVYGCICFIKLSIKLVTPRYRHHMDVSSNTIFPCVYFRHFSHNFDMRSSLRTGRAEVYLCGGVLV